MTQTICPQEIRIANKRAGLGTIWQSQEWRDESTAYKARHPPVCSRCGCVGPIVPGHSGEDYTPAEMHDYIGKVRRDEVQPLCHRCNKMEAKGRHPCPSCIEKHREDPEHFIRYIGQDQEVCGFCERQDAGLPVTPAARWKRKQRRTTHPCDHNKGLQRCFREGRITICPYSARNAASRCDPDHFKAREKWGAQA